MSTFVKSLVVSNGLIQSGTAAQVDSASMVATGVAAGSYGDASHTLTVQVDTAGRVVSISANAISAGSGTVTSVAMTGDGTVFNSVVSGSPITTSGTLAPTLKSQSANVVLAGPTTGAAAAPTFRALVAADIPAINLASGVTGILPVANGGTGTSTPSLVAGTNVTITGSWPNQTISATGGSSSGGVDANFGTSYTIPTSDLGKLVTFQNSSPMTATLPQSAGTGTGTGTGISPNWFCDVQNQGAGLLTLSAGALTIDSGTSITLAAGQGVRVFSDGTAYYTQRGRGVLSVGLSLPSFITVSGSPVTTTGTLTGTLATQSANVVFAGPTSGGAAAPTFRALVAADIPAINLASGVTGILPIANGGTGTSTPGLVAGTNVTITGSWPNQTINNAVPVDNGLCEYRLTFTSGDPTQVADTTVTTSSGTLYLSPYKGNRIALFYSSAWRVLTPGEISLSTSTFTSVIPYDVFASTADGSTVTLSAASWTNGTTRTTALTLQDGVLVKSGDATKRYLGTFYGGSFLYDTALKRRLWNYYNRVKKPFYCNDPTSSWTYASATWRQANGNVANQVDLVCGVQEGLLDLELLAFNSGSSVAGNVEFGEDTVTTPSLTNALGSQNNTVSGQTVQTLTIYRKFPAIGYHYYAWLEYSQSGTITFYGKHATLNFLYSGITGIWEC